MFAIVAAIAITRICRTVSEGEDQKIVLSRSVLRVAEIVEHSPRGSDALFPRFVQRSVRERESTSDLRRAAAAVR
jgi:hypothetical protein